MIKFVSALSLASFVASPWAAFAQSPYQETIVLQRPEEYQLRILESQIQLLRNKLYAQQKMTDEQHQKWLDQYQDVAKRLAAWNKFQGRYNIE